MRMTAKPAQIRKVARIRDKATGNYFEVIEFPVSDTERVRIELPPSVIVDPGAFERRLRDAGAILPKKNVRDFLKAVAGRKAPKELTYEARTGWTDNRTLFVLNDGVIGRSKDRILGVNQGRLSSRRCQWTLIDGWHVAKLAFDGRQGSPIIVDPDVRGL